MFHPLFKNIWFLSTTALGFLSGGPRVWRVYLRSGRTSHSEVVCRSRTKKLWESLCRIGAMPIEASSFWLFLESIIWKNIWNYSRIWFLLEEIIELYIVESTYYILSEVFYPELLWNTNVLIVGTLENQLSFHQNYPEMEVRAKQFQHVLSAKVEK